MRNRIVGMILGLAFTLSWALIPFKVEAQGGNPAPKCEKCYRGPDGKIKCEPVPCPK